MLLMAVLCASAALCADTPDVMLPCPDSSGPKACVVSRKDQKEAKSAFSRGLKLQKERQLEDAYAEFQAAAHLVPQNARYLTAKEMARQQLVFNHIQAGNAQLLQGKQVEAVAEFRTALELDPQNEFAQQRLHDSLGDYAPRPAEAPQMIDDEDPVDVHPKAGAHDFRFRGDTRGLLTQVTQAYGVTAIFDDSVAAKRVRFEVENVDFFKAMELAGSVTHTFFSPLSDKEVLIAADTVENHRQFDQMALRTFYVGGVTAPQELTELVTVLRTMFEIKFLTQQPGASTLVMSGKNRTFEVKSNTVDKLYALAQSVVQ